jgi:small conductance mechanosensitive channel
MDVSWSDLSLFAEEHLLPAGLRILIALAVFFVGRLVARTVIRGMQRVMERSGLDVSLRKFLSDLVYAVALVAIVIASLDTLGVKTTAVVAVLGAAGLAVGLALQGSLSNFAAGVMLIVLRPYKVGDLVTIGKYMGRVEAIKIFHTILITADYREITIPNGQIIIAPIENLTILGRRRVDLVVTINQAADIQEVRTLIEKALLAEQWVQQSPKPSIDVAEITEATVKLHVRPWTASDHVTDVATETMEALKEAMAASNIKFSIAVAAA